MLSRVTDMSHSQAKKSSAPFLNLSVKNDLMLMFFSPAHSVPFLPLQAGSSDSRRDRRRRSAFDGASPPSTITSTGWVPSPETPRTKTTTTTTSDGNSSSKSNVKVATAAANVSNAAFLGSVPLSSDMPSDTRSDQGSPVDPRQVKHSYMSMRLLLQSSAASASSRPTRVLYVFALPWYFRGVFFFSRACRV